MDLATDAVTTEHRANVLRGMRDFMEEEEVGYDESHITACDAILAKFLKGMDRATDRAAGLACAREAVEALNELVELTDGELIETDQREDICLLIMRAGELRGFNAADEDVTEEWREW